MHYIYGNDEFLIEEQIKKIIQTLPKSEVVYFNSETKLNEIINQISTFSLFSSNRILIFKNFHLISKPSLKADDLLVINSLKYKPDGTTIIFTSEKLNEKNKQNELFYFIREKANCVECPELNDKQVMDFSRKRIDDLGGTINDMDLVYLLSKLPNRLSFIVPEIDKLLALDKNISKSNIDDLIQKQNITNAFDFINALQNNNVETIFKTYYDKINEGELIRNLINQILNTLEVCSIIFSLEKQQLNDDQIANKINKHIFVIKKNKQLLHTLGFHKVFVLHKLISDLDVKIKTGRIDEKLGFERFLLEFIRY